MDKILYTSKCKTNSDCGCSDTKTPMKQKESKTTGSEAMRASIEMEAVCLNE